MRTHTLMLSVAVLLATGSAHAAQPDRQDAIDRALKLIQRHGATFKLDPATPLTASVQVSAGAAAPAAGDRFEAREVMVDADGTEHVRFDRYNDGLEVIGGDVVVHSRQGQLRYASLSQAAAVELTGQLEHRGATVAPRSGADIGQARAVDIARGRFDGAVDAVEAPALVVYARGPKPLLAYRVHVTGQALAVAGGGGATHWEPRDSDIYVATADGTVLGRSERQQPAAAVGLGRTLYLGDVPVTGDRVLLGYDLRDPSRGNGEVRDAFGRDPPYGANWQPQLGVNVFSTPNNVWGDGTVGSRASAAADIAYGLATAWDFYKNVFARNGIFNDGKGVTSYAHVGNRLDNAFWNNDCRCMRYGDGSGTAAGGFNTVVELDVAGHEMTHGVTFATARLTYDAGDAGGLNEGTSDIFGTLIEFYANNRNDPGDYTIGEKLVANPDGTRALRYMFKPSLDKFQATLVDGSATTIGSFDCALPGGFANGETLTLAGGAKINRYDAHFTSGVTNHFFYLLAEGAVVPAAFAAKLAPADLVCNGNTALAGIGRDKAGKIWYKALTQYFTSGTTYTQARLATLAAASDLYGAASTEYQAVAAAWDAVKVTLNVQ